MGNTNYLEEIRTKYFNLLRSMLSENISPEICFNKEKIYETIANKICGELKLGESVKAYIISNFERLLKLDKEAIEELKRYIGRLVDLIIDRIREEHKKYVELCPEIIKAYIVLKKFGRVLGFTS